MIIITMPCHVTTNDATPDSTVRSTWATMYEGTVVRRDCPPDFEPATTTVHVDAGSEIRRNLVGKRARFNLSVENEQADAGRDGQTCLARQNSPARTGTGKTSGFPAQLTTSRIVNHTRLINTLLKVPTIQTYY